MALPAWTARLSAPLLRSLKQGLAPRPAALALSLGLWLGVLPVLGATTVACVLAGLALRLNQGLLLAASLLAYPLQLLLILPFYAWGARAFHAPAVGLSPDELLARARQAPWALLRDLGWTVAHGVALWALLGLALVPLMWALFVPLLRRLDLRRA